jgi:lipid-A-disaccharide synthase
MENQKKHLIIVAGEASGDERGAELVAEMRKRDPHLTFSGLGGQQMIKAGVDIYVDLASIGVVGFTEVFKHLQTIKKAFDLILTKIDEQKPAAVILVDYPGFNLRLAKELKKRKVHPVRDIKTNFSQQSRTPLRRPISNGVKVIYYVSPQVWAWNAKRIELIKNVVDKMLVFFKFEEELYAQHGYKVDFVGHPLIDRVKVNLEKDTFLKNLGLSNNCRTIGLLPGSREKEVQNIFPVMLKAAEYLFQKNPEFQFLALKASTINIQIFEQYIKNVPFPIRVISEKTYDGINACDFCLVASGTATLETAILNKPMIVIYKTSLLTWALAKCLIKIPNIGLVNIVAGKRIVPECVQFDANAKTIAYQTIGLLSHEEKLDQIKQALSEIKDILGVPGASARAAQKILAFIS